MNQEPMSPYEQEIESSYNPYVSEKKTGGKGKRNFFLFLLVLVIGIVAFVLFFFQIRSIEVIGNHLRSKQEVLNLAGIGIGDNLLFANKNKVEEGINADRYLIFAGMYPLYPSQLFIQVYERLPIGMFQYMGVTYTTDMEGMVLEQEEIVGSEEKLVYFRGLDIKECKLGSFFSCRSDKQFLAYKKILEELNYQTYYQEVRECNLSSIDNISLISVYGFKIRLGDSSDMRAKIGAARAVISKLIELNAPIGTLDVSSPIYPTFIPDE
ncbi:MAG: FtsQ-type POTRA domain-containing protein [Clostridiales bacterium]|nr:FtsQ-type POTRA domain-containing protein [Clostridiales bacterium]